MTVIPLQLGFIGLGIMGGPMAGHLLKAGHALHAYTRGSVPAELLAAGASACASAREVAERAQHPAEADCRRHEKPEPAQCRSAHAVVEDVMQECPGVVARVVPAMAFGVEQPPMHRAMDEIFGECAERDRSKCGADKSHSAVEHGRHPASGVAVRLRHSRRSSAGNESGPRTPLRRLKCQPYLM